MTIYFKKSGHLGVTWVHKLESKQKLTNLSFFLYYCNQIHYQTGYMGRLVHVIRKTLYWYHTEASWPYISNAGHSGETWVHKLVSKKIDVFELFVYDCNQIEYRLGHMGQFVHIICNSLYLYHTEVSWPFISIAAAFGCNMYA